MITSRVVAAYTSAAVKVSRVSGTVTRVSGQKNACTYRALFYAAHDTMTTMRLADTDGCVDYGSSIPSMSKTASK